MVFHQEPNRAYWTLPGGGVFDNETLEKAILREIKEETNLDTQIKAHLFKEPYSQGICHYYLLAVDNNQEPSLGIDPEEIDLPPNDRMLKDIAWHTLESMKDDIQVSKVLKYLNK